MIIIKLNFLNIFFSLIYRQLGLILQVYENILGTKNQGVNFQLYGADIAIDNQLKPLLMELNKGPDMNAKDTRDKNLKENLAKDILKSVNLLPDDETNGFINILELININGNLVPIENILTTK